MVNDHMSVSYQYLYNTENGEPYIPRPGDVLESPDGRQRLIVNGMHTTTFGLKKDDSAFTVLLMAKHHNPLLRWINRDWMLCVNGRDSYSVPCLQAIVNAFGWKVVTRGPVEKEPARE